MATEKYEYGYNAQAYYGGNRPITYDDEDVFGHEEGHDVSSHPMAFHKDRRKPLTVDLYRSSTRRCLGNWSPCS